MASLDDFSKIYAPTSPAGLDLAQIALQRANASTTADVGRSRIIRDFGQWALPDLVGSQAARGAFFSSATQNKKNRLGQAAADQLGDIALGTSTGLAGLAGNAALVGTGFQLRGY